MRITLLIKKIPMYSLKLLKQLPEGEKVCILDRAEDDDGYFSK